MISPARLHRPPQRHHSALLPGHREGKGDRDHRLLNAGGGAQAPLTRKMPLQAAQSQLLSQQFARLWPLELRILILCLYRGKSTLARSSTSRTTGTSRQESQHDTGQIDFTDQLCMSHKGCHNSHRLPLCSQMIKRKITKLICPRPIVTNNRS